MSRITFALAKGRLAKKTLEILDKDPPNLSDLAGIGGVSKHVLFEYGNTQSHNNMPPYEIGYCQVRVPDTPQVFKTKKGEYK